ncbi:hypothetical protein ACG33_03830 [Steroidobacter denitrificans]|uniref:2,4-diaminopentanoate dehydrogenase C-terminal domain-containing protein n=1 Tax=Steroidobacter denitrificans TaxID=465721 RepID=A0A127F9G3_STEDE|nr:hypothetical protein [Steroidobacter denitrificans]AMN46248.1 hypothetical protein ACG33_03830 [Steroidobacter denitrificans]
MKAAILQNGAIHVAEIPVRAIVDPASPVRTVVDSRQGGVRAPRMSYCGLIGDKSIVELQLIWRLGYAMTPDWQVEGYVIEIQGEPSVRVSFYTEKSKTGSGTTTAMNAVHAIPTVCAAHPGIITAAKPPPITAAYCIEMN